MNKFSSAALALFLLPSAAQAEITLDLGGYFRAYAGYSAQDANNLRKTDLKRRSQLYFMGQTKLDNDLVLGYYSTLLQENNSTLNATQVERSYLYVSNDLGRINLGRETGAASLLQVTAPGADSNIDGYNISFSFYNTGLREDYEHASVRNKYADKLTYISPKINGLQTGISYTPNGNSRTTQDRFGMPQKQDATFHDIWDIAARYEGKLSEITIQTGAGYSHASAESQARTTGIKDREIYNAALKFGIHSFGFGGAFLHENSGTANGMARTWIIGADYKAGAYTFGTSYFNTKDKSSDEALDRYVVGASYHVASGVKFNTSLGFYDANAAAGNNDATTVIFGTDIRF